LAPKARAIDVIKEMLAAVTAHEGVARTTDAISFVVVLGALASFLPPLAALLTIIWTGIRIYELETVQRLLKRKGKK
jgi:hypothetical protein